jgi:hypothetical protein
MHKRIRKEVQAVQILFRKGRGKGHVTDMDREMRWTRIN